MQSGAPSHLRGKRGGGCHSAWRRPRLPTLAGENGALLAEPVTLVARRPMSM